MYGSKRRRGICERYCIGEKADFVVHHDGEQTICELMDALTAGEKDFSKIDGLTWLGDDGTPVTNTATIVTRFRFLPYPAWHLFPYHKYGLLPFADFAKPVLTMTGSEDVRIDAITAL